MPLRPQISGRGRVEFPTDEQLKALIDAELVYYCYCCDDHHVYPNKAWDDVDDFCWRLETQSDK